MLRTESYLATTVRMEAKQRQPLKGRAEDLMDQIWRAPSLDFSLSEINFLLSVDWLNWS